MCGTIAKIVIRYDVPLYCLPTKTCDVVFSGFKALEMKKKWKDIVDNHFFFNDYECYEEAKKLLEQNGFVLVSSSRMEPITRENGFVSEEEIWIL